MVSMHAADRKPRSAMHKLAVMASCASLGVPLGGCGGDPTGEASTQADGPAIAAGELDGTSMPPWPAPSNVPDRVADAELDLGPMGMAEHYHPELEIIVDGREVPVAPNIGVDPATGAMSAVHTHTPDGVVHVEATEVGEIFTLGQLFTEWGVTLSADQIGGARAKAGESVTVTVNGAPYNGPPAELRLEPDQKIVVQVG